MIAERLIEGCGTSEAEWLSCAALRAVPFVSAPEIVPRFSRAVVLAPHPDDEILPCGGLLQALAEGGQQIAVVAVTDGEGSHPPGSAWSPSHLRAARPRESSEALRRLRLGRIEMHRLGFPDGGVAEREDALCEMLQRLLQPEDTLLVPWRWDGHPDHEATMRCALALADEVGCKLIEMPIWGWHWSEPETTPLPWGTAVRLALPPLALARKRDALQAFTSQLAPDVESGAPAILPPHVLQRFTRPWELFLP